MPELKYPLTCDTWGPEELEAIRRVTDSGRFTMGDQVRRFERLFADRIGRKHAVMVNSGSSANLLGVAALSFQSARPLRPGDEVIVPAVSWATTYYPLLQYGLRLRFVDIELDTLNLDVSRLEEALTERTRMLVAVSILGNPCGLGVMKEFCERHSLLLFEDNCESLGAEIDALPTGAFGDVATFSTFYSHHISTMEGGLLLTDDDEIHELALSLRAHGWTRELPRPSRLCASAQDDFAEAYRFILPGYNLRPLEFSGAVGIEQLKKLDSMLERRRRNAELFQALFRGDDRFLIQRENGKSSWFSFTLILNPDVKTDRKTVFSALTAAGIEFRMITGGNFLRHDVIRFFDFEPSGTIVHADTAHDRGFFVGNAPADLSDRISLLRSTLDKVVR